MTQEEQIKEAVTNFPGRSISEIVSLVGINPEGARSVISRMCKSGALIKDAKKHLHMGDPNAKIKWNTVPWSERKKRVTQRAQVVNQQNELEKLQGLVIELEEWKKQAIARYPDLAVKPVVLEARKIVSNWFHSQGDISKRNQVLEGRLDNSPMMQVTLLALES